jgi:hypothetical protein
LSRHRKYPGIPGSNRRHWYPHVAIVVTVEEADEAQAIEKYRAAHPDVPEYATFILQVIVDQVAMTTGGSRADVCRDRA